MELRLERVFLYGEDDEDGARALEMHTDAGVIHGRYHGADSGDAVVIWVFGAAGGLGGPAGGMYTRLAKRLADKEISSLRLDYRHPGDLVSSVLDVFAAVHHLQAAGFKKVILVGHSFGGAVVINAGAANLTVSGVAALSSQSSSTESVAELAGRPLLLMHGTRDEVLPASCSDDIYKRAAEPKEIRLYDCMHGLDECREAVDRDLTDWIGRALDSVQSPQPAADAV
jgi:dienelactone hydrolase